MNVLISSIAVANRHTMCALTQPRTRAQSLPNVVSTRRAANHLDRCNSLTDEVPPWMLNSPSSSLFVVTPLETPVETPLVTPSSSSYDLASVIWKGCDDEDSPPECLSTSTSSSSSSSSSSWMSHEQEQEQQKEEQEQMEEQKAEHSKWKADEEECEVALPHQVIAVVEPSAVIMKGWSYPQFPIDCTDSSSSIASDDFFWGFANDHKTAENDLANRGETGRLVDYKLGEDEVKKDIEEELTFKRKVSEEEDENSTLNRGIRTNGLIAGNNLLTQTLHVSLGKIHLRKVGRHRRPNRPFATVSLHFMLYSAYCIMTQWDLELLSHLSLSLCL